MRVLPFSLVDVFAAAPLSGNGLSVFVLDDDLPGSALQRITQEMRQFEKRVLDTEAHEIFLLWRYRIVPYRSYLKGWKIGPSHYVNQDLATIWLDK